MPDLQPALEWDAAACQRVNRMNRRPWPRRLFRAVSRLGDGVFWYALMLLPFTALVAWASLALWPL
ncbi:MAG: hypothetical protein ACOZDY_19860 [Pseudomonadota bacterium]